MTEAQAIEALYSQFVTAFSALHHQTDPGDATYCPIALEGEVFTAVETWVRFSVVPDSRDQMTMGPTGSRKLITGGFVAIQVFTPLGGVLSRAQLCDDVRSCIELKTLAVTGIDERVRTFQAPSRNPTSDGRWLIQTVVTEFAVIATGV